MSHEIGQLDISNHQLMTKSKSKASDWTEIGEATITHSFFGKAEVRIVRKFDALRRALSLLLLFSLLAVAAWLGWVGFQQNYPAPSADLSSPLSAKDEVTTPATLTEKSAVSALQPPAKNNVPSQAKSAHVQKAASQMTVMPESASQASTASPSAHAPKPPLHTAAATPRTVRIAASSPAATDSPNKVDATHLPVDNSQ